MIGYKYIDGTDVLRKSQTPTINIFFKKSPRLKVANYLRKVASPQMLDQALNTPPIREIVSKLKINIS